MIKGEKIKSSMVADTTIYLYPLKFEISNMWREYGIHVLLFENELNSNNNKQTNTREQRTTKHKGNAAALGSALLIYFPAIHI